jgi:outer membrane protein, multidrug efflux system
MNQLKSFRNVSTLLLAMLVLAGCAAPDFKQPEVATPTSFKESTAALKTPVSADNLDANANAQWKLAQPAEASARGEWWTTFSDPALDALEAEAVGANADLYAAAARVKQARALLRTAEADRIPQVNAGAQALRGRSSDAALGIPQGTKVPTSNFFQGGLSASYEVDLFGRVANNVNAAKADANATEATYRSVLLVLQADVAQTYYNLRESDAEFALLKETVRLREDNVKLAQSRFNAGDISEIDLTRARTERATAQSDAIGIERQRAVAEHALAVLLGRAPAGFDFGVNPLMEVSNLPSIPAGLPSSLLERRPDIAAAQQQMFAANARIGVAKSAIFPALSLTGQGGAESYQLSDLFKLSSTTWLIGAVMSLPIVDGGRNKANIKRAEADLEESVGVYRQHVLTAFAEVEDNLVGLRTLDGQARVTDEAVASARRASDLAEKRYRAGETGYLEAIDAQRELLAVQRQAVQLRGARATTTVALIRSLGGGWESAK